MALFISKNQFNNLPMSEKFTRKKNDEIRINYCKPSESVLDFLKMFARSYKKTSFKDKSALISLN